MVNVELNKPISKGARVRLWKDFPSRQGFITGGRSGKVVFNDGDCLGVKLDDPVRDLEDWDNIVHFYGDHVTTSDPEDEVLSLCEAAD